MLGFIEIEIIGLFDRQLFSLTRVYMAHGVSFDLIKKIYVLKKCSTYRLVCAAC